MRKALTANPSVFLRYSVSASFLSWAEVCSQLQVAHQKLREGILRPVAPTWSAWSTVGNLMGEVGNGVKTESGLGMLPLTSLEAVWHCH